MKEEEGDSHRSTQMTINHPWDLLQCVEKVGKQKAISVKSHDVDFFLLFISVFSVIIIELDMYNRYVLMVTLKNR